MPGVVAQLLNAVRNAEASAPSEACEPAEPTPKAPRAPKFTPAPRTPKAKPLAIGEHPRAAKREPGLFF